MFKKKKTNHKKWLTYTLIVLVLLTLFFQPCWQTPTHQVRIPKAVQILVPPLVFLYQYFDFNEKGALKNWKEKLFQGRVVYQLEFDGPNGFVHSKSKKSASAFFYRIKYDANEFPYLSWKWRVGKFPDKKNSQTEKARDDYAARVYVIFASRFFTNFKCLEYVWDESLPEETPLNSPFSDQIKQLTIESGKKSPSQWVPENRNVMEDYQKLFGEKPKMKVAAIALMTDAEGTNSEAEGYFDDIQIGKK